MMVPQFLDSCGEPVTLCGYIAPFNRDSLPGHGTLPSNWTYRIRPGAFSDALAQPWSIPLVTNHSDREKAYPTATSRNDSLKLWEDRYGLAFEASGLAVTARNAALLIEIAEGKAGCSFQCQLPEFNDDPKNRVREVVKCNAIEEVTISIWGERPAFPDVAVWLSHYGPDDVGSRVRHLMESWRDGKEIGQKMAIANRSFASCMRRPPRKPSPTVGRRDR